jgi:hypothetical protein
MMVYVNVKKFRLTRFINGYFDEINFCFKGKYSHADNKNFKNANLIFCLGCIII